MTTFISDEVRKFGDGEAMPRKIEIEIDDGLAARLEARATLNARSVREEITEILSLAAPKRLTPEERVALVRRIREMAPDGVEQTDSTTLIRQARDAC